MDPSVLFSQEVILPSSAWEFGIFVQSVGKEAKRKKKCHCKRVKFLSWDSSAAFYLAGEEIGNAVSAVSRWCQG